MSLKIEQRASISEGLYQEITILQSFKLQQMEVRLFPLAKVALAFKWSLYVENEQKKFQGKIPKPFSMVDALVRNHLVKFHSRRPILDIGCETGKNALSVIRGGHKVVLLDIAPAALTYTLSNLKKIKMDHGVVKSILGKLESIKEDQGPFKAVIGTFAFSFVSPKLFYKVLKQNVLAKIEPGGFFAGGFFGPEHMWKKNPSLTFVDVNWLKKFFMSHHFSILAIRENKERKLNEGKLEIFHAIGIIAQRMF